MGKAKKTTIVEKTGVEMNLEDSIKSLEYAAEVSDDSVVKTRLLKMSVSLTRTKDNIVKREATAGVRAEKAVDAGLRKADRLAKAKAKVAKLQASITEMEK